MVTTRSSSKRKSIDSSPVAPQTLPDSAPKRRKLPLRKKTAKLTSSEIPDSDDADESLMIEEEGEEGSDEEIDLDAALQEQVAAQNPDTPAVKRTDAQKSAAVAEEEDDEEDSDDEAPEAVSNVQAASKAREAAEAMMKAARGEADRLRQKRKERDLRLKEQAQSRKSKQDALKEEGPAAEPQDQDEDAAAPGTEIQTIPAADDDAPRRPNKSETTLLPEEFLDSDSEPEEEEGAEPAAKRRRAEKKRSRAPRDKRVGGTVYRVVQEADSRMAPRKEARSKNVRAALLKRGREAGGRKGGFVVGKGRVDWGTSRKA